MSTPLARPVTFECPCGNKHSSAGSILPAGWSNRQGAIRCQDCTPAPARRPAQRRAA